MSDNIELNLDDLEAVSGGAQTNDFRQAYCRQCGKKLTKDGVTYKNGNLSGVYHCMNADCTEYKKLKYDDNVLLK